MKLDELDAKMQPYEKAADVVVLPEIHILARLDGRSFTQLTKERHAFERPYDERFRDYMLATTEHLMSCGFKIVYGYTQSDEISLLFHRDDTTYGRLTRKINSVLAGEASAKVHAPARGSRGLRLQSRSTPNPRGNRRLLSMEA